MPESISILHIEDDLVDQMAFRAQVTAEKLPYRVVVASSLAEAREALASVQEFDVVITDYQLKDGNSFELFDALHGRLVIFTTGAGDEETAIRALRLGVRDYLIKDPDRQYLKLISHRIDRVLRQWRMEHALAESEERHRDFIENANDLIQLVGMDGSIQYVNRAWRETLGYTEAEVPGLSLLNILHSSCQEHCMAMFKRAVGGEDLRGIEAIFVTKDGREILVEGSTNSQIVDERPVVTRSIFRDVTEKKRAEIALRAKNEELERALAEVKQLQGILPICSHCKKIRDDENYWQEVEAYVEQHSAAQFSHGICPDCIKRFHPQVYERLKAKGKI